jgi:hypothetical protein
MLYGPYYMACVCELGGKHPQDSEGELAFLKRKFFWNHNVQKTNWRIKFFLNGVSFGLLKKFQSIHNAMALHCQTNLMVKSYHCLIKSCWNEKDDLHSFKASFGGLNVV